MNAATACLHWADVTFNSSWMYSRSTRCVRRYRYRDATNEPMDVFLRSIHLTRLQAAVPPHPTFLDCPTRQQLFLLGASLASVVCRFEALFKCSAPVRSPTGWCSVRVWRGVYPQKMEDRACNGSVSVRNKFAQFVSRAAKSRVFSWSCSRKRRQASRARPTSSPPCSMRVRRRLMWATRFPISAFFRFSTTSRRWCARSSSSREARTFR